MISTLYYIDNVPMLKDCLFFRSNLAEMAVSILEDHIIYHQATDPIYRCVTGDTEKLRVFYYNSDVEEFLDHKIEVMPREEWLPLISKIDNNKPKWWNFFKF